MNTSPVAWSAGAGVEGQLARLCRVVLGGAGSVAGADRAAELLTHKASTSQARPTLPQQAGRALTKLYAAAAYTAAQEVQRRAMPAGSPKRTRQQVRTIQVYGVVKPEIDLQAVARVLVDIAKHLDDEPPEPGHVEDRLAG